MSDENEIDDTADSILSPSMRQALRDGGVQIQEFDDLPCAAHFRTKNYTTALAACEDAKAYRECTWMRRGKCVRDDDANRLAKIAGGVRSSGCPHRVAEMVVSWWPSYQRDKNGYVGDLVPAREPCETVALKKAREFADGNAWALVLSGGVGVGKTVAAAYVLARIRGRYEWAPNLTKLDAPVEEMVKAPMLVLDDLGIEHVGESTFALSRIAEILCARYDRAARTVVTTNLRADKFRQRYGERVSDRLRDGGIYVELPGKSLRGDA